MSGNIENLIFFSSLNDNLFTLSLQDVPEDFSVFKIVEKMRQQRPAMVQAKDQYSFVYSAVAELSQRSIGLNPTVPPKPTVVCM